MVAPDPAVSSPGPAGCGSGLAVGFTASARPRRRLRLPGREISRRDRGVAEAQRPGGPAAGLAAAGRPFCLGAGARAELNAALPDWTPGSRAGRCGPPGDHRVSSDRVVPGAWPWTPTGTFTRVLEPDAMAKPRTSASTTGEDAGYQLARPPPIVQPPAAVTCPWRLMTSSSPWSGRYAADLHAQLQPPRPGRVPDGRGHACPRVGGTRRYGPGWRRGGRALGGAVRGVPAGDHAGPRDQPGPGRDRDARPHVAAAVPAAPRAGAAAPGPDARFSPRPGLGLSRPAGCFLRGGPRSSPGSAASPPASPGTGAVRQVAVDDTAVSGLDGSEQVDPQLQPDCAARSVAAHGPEQASHTMLPIPASTFTLGPAVQADAIRVRRSPSVMPARSRSHGQRGRPWGRGVPVHAGAVSARAGPDAGRGSAAAAVVTATCRGRARRPGAGWLGHLAERVGPVDGRGHLA